MPKKQKLGERAEKAAALLRSERALCALLERKHDKLRELRARAEGGGCFFGGMPSGHRSDVMAEAAASLMDAEAQWAGTAVELAAVRRALGRALDALSPEDALLIELRWRQGMPWEGVAQHLYLCERQARRRNEGALTQLWAAYEACLKEETDGSTAAQIG